MTEYEKKIEYKKAAELRETLQKKYPRKTEEEIQNTMFRRIRFLNILAKVMMTIEIVLIFFVVILGAFSLFMGNLLSYAGILAAVVAGIISHKVQKTILSKIPHSHACFPILPLTLERIYRNCKLQISGINAHTASEPIHIIRAFVSHMERNHSADAETQDEYILFFGRYSYHVSPSAYEWADVGDLYYLIFRGQGDPIAIYSAAANRPDSVVSALLRDEKACQEDTSQADFL